MQNRAVAIVWGAGLTLAVIVYAVGPDSFLQAAFTLSDRLGAAIEQAVLAVGARAYDGLRALAIASFAVFFVLSVIAAGRGLPGRWLLFVVTLLFLLLVWHEGREATGHWMLALLLAMAGAGSMTRRLTAPPPRPLA